jgi:hypothetical protein
MWVLVVLAVNAHMAFSSPGYSTEQTCSAKGKEIIALTLQKKGGGNRVYH